MEKARRNSMTGTPLVSRFFTPPHAPQSPRDVTRRLLHRLDDGACELVCAGRAAYVARADFAFVEDFEHCALDAVGRFALVYVAEHEYGRLQKRRGVRDVLARDVGRGAVHGLEDRAALANVC